MQIPFGEWRPDIAAMDSGVLVLARNALPNSQGWGPMPSIVEFGSDALPDGCLGACFVTKADGSFRIFAGTTTKLNELDAGSWDDTVTRGSGDYNTLAGYKWRFERMGTMLVAVNGSDENQIIDIESGTEFDDQGGSPPVAWDLKVIEDYMFLMDATDRTRMVVSDFNDPEGWTLGTGTCDEFFAQTGGTFASAPLMGTNGLILQTGEEARRLILNRGFERPWQLETIQGVRGAVFGYNAVSTKIGAMYVAEDGIYVMTPDGGNTKLGDERVDAWFTDRLDSAYTQEVLGFRDPYSQRVYFAFHSGSNAGNYDRLLGYDIDRNRFFYGEVTAAFWCPIVSPGATLEEVSTDYPDLDAMPVSLDSAQFKGGRPTVGGVSTGGNLMFLSGEALEATFRTAKFNFAPGSRAFLKEAALAGVMGDASPTLRITRSEFDGDTETTKGPFTRSSRTGKYRDLNTSGRVFDVELTIPAGTSWEFLQGLMTIEQADGDR